ncbi:hypothetical protein [Paraliomyxa miuraensis]|uniref:hypothetical protein n=1 Tax=Paraliomyxa miuraensis TaxID=376150 RepID=UPI00224F9702|nr:hypothetical protein [Paraliomyxa miuraensis]MCX4242537.1 hypothetical protein [Paraliomyxa miuraensis]
MRTTRFLLRSCLLLLAIPPLCAGCPMDGADDDHTGDEASLPPETFSVLGQVTRSAAAVPVDDGVGTLWIAVFTACELGAPLVAAVRIDDADVSQAGVPVPFEIVDLPPGEHHVALFLDDDGNANPMAPLPDPGDLVYETGLDDGVLSCIPVEVIDEDVEGLALVLTGVMPGA